MKPESAAPSPFANVLLIARREYLERIRTRAFLIATVLIPLLMGGFVFGSGYLATRTRSNAHVAVVSSDLPFAQDLQGQLEHGKRSNMTVDLYTPSAATRTSLNSQLQARDGITGYLWITPATQPGARPLFSYVPRSASDAATRDALQYALQATLTREHLLHSGMAAPAVDDLLAPVSIDTSSVGNTTAAYAAATLFFLLMYMVIMLYGMNTARSIIEEKTSRVFEVMLATIRPDELLAGKILGVGAVGLTQIGVWMAAALLLGSTGLAARFTGSSEHLPISIGQIVSFIAYFLFGYLLYSSIAAALGAMTNSEQELQQLNMFLVLPLAFCMFMSFVIVRAPNGTLARVVSLIPFCSPLLMNLRISLTTVAPWEIALSFVLMSLTILAVLWIASRIYRVGILMYGKKPDLPEILRWLRYT